MAPPLRRPPYLMPDLIVGEILVRFPPDDPAFLVRASVVCKPWRQLLCDPSFRRRYAAFHRAPPLLGFLHNWNRNSYPVTHPRFVSTTTPSPLPLKASVVRSSGWCWHVLDCRHGRVLFKAPNMSTRDGRLGIHSLKLVVLDPASGKQNCLPEPPFPESMAYTAAVLCAVRGCDHLDCHCGPFVVVFVGFNIQAGALHSCLYSSETTTWNSSSANRGFCFPTVPKPSVLIFDNIYFLVDVPSVTILKVDLAKNDLSIINCPWQYKVNVVLMAMEDGSLGFTTIQDSKLFLWLRNVLNSEVAGGWAQCKVIELQTKIPFNIRRLRVVGSQEGSDIIFVASDVAVFSLDLKSGSGHARKIDEPMEYFAIFPFMSFYTPGGIMQSRSFL